MKQKLALYAILLTFSINTFAMKKTIVKRQAQSSRKTSKQNNNKKPIGKLLQEWDKKGTKKFFAKYLQ